MTVKLWATEDGQSQQIRRTSAGLLRPSELGNMPLRKRSKCVGQGSVPVFGGVLVPECGRRARVPGTMHQLSGGRSRSGRPGEPGVTKVVKVEVRPAGRYPRSLPGPVEGARRYRQTPFAGEQPGVLSRLHLVGEMSGQHGHDVVRDGDGPPARFSFGWANCMGAVRMDDEGPLNAEFPVQLVDVPTLEPEHLAPPELAPGCQ